MAVECVPPTPAHIKAGFCPAPTRKGSNPQSLAQLLGHIPAYLLGWSHAINR